MIRATTAIMAMAACGYMAVVFVPGLTPAAGARTAPKAALGSTVTAGTVRNAGKEGSVQCFASWPYYEPACLHDGRAADGRARVVRIIPTTRTALAGSSHRTR